MMFRLNKMSAKLGSANAVQLTSFSHTNGESTASTQERPAQDALQKNIRLNKKSEILGPTGTVRGFKNIISERKEFLRLSFVGETFQVGHNALDNSTQI